MRRGRISAVLGGVLVVCMACAIFLVTRIDRLRPAATLEEVIYIPSPRVLRGMSLGYTGLLADIYWTRAVQYFGRQHVQRSTQYKLLPVLLNITTQLDPHLIAAYEFGSIFLSEPPPNGAGMPDKAIELVKYGIQQNPDDWHLYYHLGFIEYMEKKDYEAAADAFLKGSQVPGAHPWMKLLAARMAEHGGELDTARFLWSKVYETSQDRQIKVNALSHLRALRVDEDVPRLEQLTLAYFKRAGRYPETWAELIGVGWLRGVPLDPAGHPYRLVPGGRVEVAVPEDLPFITEGLPPGVRASHVPRL